MNTAPSMPLTLDNLRVACGKALPYPLADTALEGLRAYLETLLKWNKVMNLVGPSDWRDVLETLVLDSFYLASFLSGLPLPAEPRCRDLGSGAGLPGIPLRLVWDKGEYVLVEAREKRALFLKTVVGLLHLPGVRVFHGRAEKNLAAEPPVDLIVSRAFMPWEKVLDLVREFVVPGGVVVFLTLTPIPDNPPAGWTGLAERSYSTAGALRHFWAFRRDDKSV